MCILTYVCIWISVCQRHPLEKGCLQIISEAQNCFNSEKNWRREEIFFYFTLMQFVLFSPKDTLV